MNENTATCIVALVDDDEDDYIIVRDLLLEIPNRPFELRWLPTYEAGLAEITAQSADVYLLDYRLGPQDGLTLLREGLAVGCQRPLILLTGRGDRDLDRVAMQAGAADYLAKDRISVLSLERALRHALDRAAALETLRDRERRYRQFFEEDLTGNYLATPDGRITDCNPAFQQMFGFASAAAAYGTHLATLYHNPAAFEQRLTALATTDRLEYIEWLGVNLTGELLYLVENMIAERDRAGQLVGLRGYIFNNTARKRLEQQLATLQKMEAMGRLAGGVAHDFNNLLTAIGTYTSLLRTHLPNPTDQLLNYITQLDRATERAGALTRQLLAFGRRQATKATVLHLNAIIAEMADMLQRLVGQHITIRQQLAPDCPPIIADQAQMEQVVMNLVVNARDAMPGGGEITISTQVVTLDAAQAAELVGLTPGEYCLLVVSDTGVGIAPEHQSRIFEPFFSTKGSDKGSGLGLAIVYSIVQQSRGQITFTSQPDSGTAFTIYLPAAAHPAAPADAVKPGAPPALIRTLRGQEVIAVAEDDDHLRGVLVETLRTYGYEVIPARTGPDLLQMVKLLTDSVQLLITDVVMPDMYGDLLAQTLRQQFPALRVLYISGHSAEHDPAQLVTDGGPGTGYLAKPFTPEGLVLKARELLNMGAGQMTGLP